MPPKNKKSNKREEKRRQVTNMLRSVQEATPQYLTKETMSVELASEYFRHILDNNVSKFGIVKLHNYALDSIFSSSQVLSGCTGNQDFLCTLVMFANMKKRDKIVAALVRCGADPSVCPDGKTNSTFDVPAALNSFPPSYCVWLIRTLFGMMAKALSKYADNNRSWHASSQSCESHEGKECVMCSDEPAAERPVIVLCWDCGHSLCWECSWRAACAPLPSTGHALRCPLQTCLKRCDGGDDDFFTTLQQGSPTLPVAGAERIQDDVEGASPRLSRKAESLAKWLELPKDLGEALPAAGVSKKPVLKAQPFHECTAQFLGTIRPQRVLELHKASSEGDCYRLHALLVAGVDLDGTNDYGQSALFVACWRGKVSSVRYLLWAGAAAGGVDNSGCGMRRAATCSLTSTAQEKRAISDLLDTRWEEGDLEVLSGLNIEGGCDLLPGLCTGGAPIVTILIPSDADHLGAGACCLDDCFSEEFLCLLEARHRACPVSEPAKPSCSARSYYCDTDGQVGRAFAAALEKLGQGAARPAVPGGGPALGLRGVFPLMRFLCYSSAGGWLPPHEDLSRSDHTCTPPVTSTHTFILYLTSCEEGGETNLLSSLGGGHGPGAGPGGGGAAVLARVRPVRGRLLLFPHRCPHEGAPAVSLPKLLLRGEAY